MGSNSHSRRVRRLKGITPNRLSWATPEHHVNIVRVAMGPGTEIEIGPSDAKSRNLYITDSKVSVFSKDYHSDTRLKITPNAKIPVKMGNKNSEVWLLEGVPSVRGRRTTAP